LLALNQSGVEGNAQRRLANKKKYLPQERTGWGPGRKGKEKKRRGKERKRRGKERGRRRTGWCFWWWKMWAGRR
jgi:hypothetical protein